MKNFKLFLYVRYLIEYKIKRAINIYIFINKKGMELNMKKVNKIKVILVTIIIILVIFTIYETVLGGWSKNKQVANQNDSVVINDESNLQQNTENRNNVKNETLNKIENTRSRVTVNEIMNTNNIEKTENIINETISNNTQDNQSKNNSDKTEHEKNSDEKTQNSNVKLDNSVAFIGDSRTQGFIMYNGLKNVQDYSYIGLMVDTAVTKKFVKTSNGEKITLLEDMKNKDIKLVYIMLGVNELGWSYPQVFKLKYGELIDEIRKVKPNCKIYVQSIIPVTKSKDQTDKIFNNKNVIKFNKLIQEVASEKNVKYLDVASALVNSEGYLPEKASTDGIHVDKKYCEKWLDYLKNNS